MEHHIKVKGKRIASFETEQDRDICLDALREYWGEEMEQEFIVEDD